MKIRRLKILSILFLLIFLLSSCGTNKKNELVGLWKSSGEESVFYNSIEFFDDGTHVTETAGWSGTYTANGNRLRISGKLYGEVFSFEITDDGNNLTLTNSLGYSKAYSRAD